MARLRCELKSLRESQPAAVQPSRESPIPPSRERLEWVDLAKGVGIILVVLWHYGRDDWRPAVWAAAGDVVFKFHMPLFMFLSGFLFTWDAARSDGFAKRYREHLGKKGVRLLVPYCTVSLAYLALKLTGQWFFAHRPVSWETLWNGLVNPLGGPATLLWFIYCLMLVFVLFPLLQEALRRDVLVLALAVGLFFAFVPREKAAELGYRPAGQWFPVAAAPPWLLLDRFCRFFLFFVCGYLCRKHGLLGRVRPEWGLAAALAVFAAVCALDPKPFLKADALAALAGALAGVLGCVWAAMVFQGAGQATSGLSLLGRHSAGIYLMHQPLAWFVAVVVHEKLGITGPAYLWGLPLAAALGLGVPIAIEKGILDRSRVLSLAVLGVRPKRC